MPLTVLALLFGLIGCTSCQREPDLPDTHTDTDQHGGDTGHGDTVDTDVDRTCPFVGVEPDGVGNPTVFALEQTACGEFSAPADGDWWQVTLPEDGWVAFRVDARSIGSRADPAIVVMRDGAVLADARDRDDGTSEDPYLRMPADPGTYELFVNEETLAGGPDEFFYHLLASVSKPPVETWDVDDTEPNDDDTHAQTIPSQAYAVVLGEATHDHDVDDYRLDVPAGAKTTFTLQIVASSLGSPADFRLDVVDGTGAARGSATEGPLSWERDPQLVVVSQGDEALYVRVREELNRHGLAYWYALEITRDVE